MGASLSTMDQQGSSGKGTSTNSATSGQPQIGQPNDNVPAPYTNTVGQWDNPQTPTTTKNVYGGKGKGG